MSPNIPDNSPARSRCQLELKSYLVKKQGKQETQKKAKQILNKYYNIPVSLGALFMQSTKRVRDLCKVINSSLQLQPRYLEDIATISSREREHCHPSLTPPWVCVQLS